MILVIVTAMVACLGIGYLIGWLTHSDHADHAQAQAAHPPAAAPRHAVTMPLKLQHVPPAHFPAQEAEGFWASVKLDEWAGSYFPGPPAPAPQPPLGELVRAERVTDFIHRLEADTDRWLAAHVEGAR